jgi:hypothetical protein
MGPVVFVLPGGAIRRFPGVHVFPGSEYGEKYVREGFFLNFAMLYDYIVI